MIKFYRKYGLEYFQNRREHFKRFPNKTSKSFSRRSSLIYPFNTKNLDLGHRVIWLIYSKYLCCSSNLRFLFPKTKDNNSSVYKEPFQTLDNKLLLHCFVICPQFLLELSFNTPNINTNLSVCGLAMTLRGQIHVYQTAKIMYIPQILFYEL